MILALPCSTNVALKSSLSSERYTAETESLPRFSPVRVTLSLTLPVFGATPVIFGEFCPTARGARHSRRAAAMKPMLRHIRFLERNTFPFSTPERRPNREEPGSTAGLLAMDLPPSCRSEAMICGDDTPGAPACQALASRTRSSASSTGRARPRRRRTYQEIPGAHETISAGSGLVLPRGPVLLAGSRCGILA